MRRRDKSNGMTKFSERRRLMNVMAENGITEAELIAAIEGFERPPGEGTLSLIPIDERSARQEGADIQRMLDAQFDQFVVNVYVAEGVLQSLIALPLFRGTPQLLSNGNSELVKQIEQFENKMAELARIPGVTVNFEECARFIDHVRLLTDNVKLLLVSKVITNKTLESLRGFIVENYNPKIAAIFEGIKVSQPGAKSKAEDWLTVETERLFADGYTEDQTAARLETRLIEQGQRRKLTKGEQKALDALQKSSNPAEMLARRVRRKNEKKADKIVLSAQHAEKML